MWRKIGDVALDVVVGTRIREIHQRKKAAGFNDDRDQVLRRDGLPLKPLIDRERLNAPFQGQPSHNRKLALWNLHTPLLGLFVTRIKCKMYLDGKSLSPNALGRIFRGENVRAGSPVRMDKKKFAEGVIERTRQARINSGLTQDQMASALGVQQGVYKTYETRTPIPLHLVERFSIIARTDEYYIIFGKTRERTIPVLPFPLKTNHN